MIKEQYYNFSPIKNQKLIAERNISFEEITAAIENGLLLDIIEHHNQSKYPKQQIYVVEVNEYVYLVPFMVEDNGVVFLKTIIPSRKAKKRYSKKESSHERR